MSCPSRRREPYACAALWLFLVITPSDFSRPVERHIESGFDSLEACKARRTELVDEAFLKMRNEGAPPTLRVTADMRCVDAGDPALGDFTRAHPDPTT